MYCFVESREALKSISFEMDVQSVAGSLWKHKKGLTGSYWKKKWVYADHEKVLQWHEKEKSDIAKESVPQHGFVLRRCKITEEGNLRPYAFKILDNDDGRSMIFAADNISEYENWLNILMGSTEKSKDVPKSKSSATETRSPSKLASTTKERNELRTKSPSKSMSSSPDPKGPKAKKPTKEEKPTKSQRSGKRNIENDDGDREIEEAMGALLLEAESEEIRYANDVILEFFLENNIGQVRQCASCLFIHRDVCGHTYPGCVAGYEGPVCVLSTPAEISEHARPRHEPQLRQLHIR